MQLAEPGKKGVYHSALRDASKDAPLRIRIKSDPMPQKPTFVKEGTPGMFFNFEHEGREYSHTFDSQACVDAIAGLNGHMVELTATGGRESAQMTVHSVAAPGSQTPPPNRAAAPHRVQHPPQPPAKNGGPYRDEHPSPTETQPMSQDDARAAREQASKACLLRARKNAMKASNAMLMALRAGHLARQTFEEETGRQLSDAHFQSACASIFIALDKGGIVNDMPYHPLPLKGHSAPPAAHPSEPPANQRPPEQPTRPDPALDEYDEDDIPF